MGFFNRVKEIFRNVFSSPFTDKETRAHKRLCDKFTGKVQLGAKSLNDIKKDMVRISDPSAKNLIDKSINKMIFQLKQKEMKKLEIRRKQGYKKFITKELKRVYELSDDKVKRLKHIIKDKEKFVPKYENDIQYVVLPDWIDMSKKIYQDLVRKLPFDQIMNIETDFCVLGDVPAEEEEKYFTEKNVKKINKYYDKHLPKNVCCNTPLGQENKYTYKDVCNGCVEYKANSLIKQNEEQYRFADKLEKKKTKKKNFKGRKLRKKDKKKKDKKKLKKEVVRKELFDVKERSLGKRPRLKKSGFEFPHIIYFTASNAVFHPQIFYPQQLSRQFFHSRHPRFKKYENEKRINEYEMEAERAYRKLLRRRYQKEVEMINNFIEYPMFFKEHIPTETCTMVLNVNCEENRKLYAACLKYMNIKNEMLKKYNLDSNMVPIKLRKEINLDEDLTTQGLDPLEAYNELQIRNEESKGMEEEEFPIDWYTEEQESDIEEGKGRIYSSKIGEQICNPTVEDNRMDVVYDYAWDKPADNLQEKSNEIVNNEKEIQKQAFNNEDQAFYNLEEVVNNTEESKVQSGKIPKNENEIRNQEDFSNVEEIKNQEYLNNEKDQGSHSDYKNPVNVTKRNNLQEYIDKNPVPKLNNNAYEQICKRHDEMIRKNKEKDEEIEKIGRKANDYIKNEVYGKSDKKAVDDNNLQKNIQAQAVPNFTGFNFINNVNVMPEQNDKSKLPEFKTDLTTETVSNFKIPKFEPNTFTNKSVPTDGVMNLNIPKFEPSTFLNNSESNQNVNVPFKLMQNNNASSMPPNPFRQNTLNVNQTPSSSSDVQQNNFNNNNTFKFPPANISPKINVNSQPDFKNINNPQIFPPSSLNSQADSKNINNPQIFSQSIPNNSFDLKNNNNPQPFGQSSINNPFDLKNKNSQIVPHSSSNNQPVNQNIMSPLNNVGKNLSSDWTPTRMPDDWRPAPRFGGTICSPLDLPRGPCIKIDPAKHGPWGPINLPDKEPPKDEDWDYSTPKPMKRDRSVSKNKGMFNIPNLTNEINTSINNSNFPAANFEQSNNTGDYKKSIDNTFSFLNNSVPNINARQVPPQEIFKSNKNEGLFDSYLKKDEKKQETEENSNVQYNNFNGDGSNGNNFFF